MQLEVGPAEAQQVGAWSKCLRRLVIELRLCPEGSRPAVDESVLDEWVKLSQDWSETSPGPQGCIRWSQEIEPERAEFLLHGLLSCLTTDFLKSALTEEERKEHEPFTLLVIENFVDALNSDGHCDRNYLEQVRSGVRMRTS